MSIAILWTATVAGLTWVFLRHPSGKKPGFAVMACIVLSFVVGYLFDDMELAFTAAFTSVLGGTGGTWLRIEVNRQYAEDMLRYFDRVYRDLR